MSKAFALSIGVGNYRLMSKLPKTADDAKDIHSLLERAYGLNSFDGSMRLLINGSANLAGVRKGLDALVRRVEEDSIVFFYFSGHGGKQGNEKLYFCTYDTDPDDLEGTALERDELIHALNQITNKGVSRLVVFLDSCYAGGIAEGSTIKNPLDKLSQSDVAKMGSSYGLIVFASSHSSEESQTLKERSNSVFTACLLDVLGGKDEESIRPSIHVSDIHRYLANEVPKRAAPDRQRLRPFWSADDFAAIPYNPSYNPETYAQQENQRERERLRALEGSVPLPEQILVLRLAEAMFSLSRKELDDFGFDLAAADERLYDWAVEKLGLVGQINIIFDMIGDCLKLGIVDTLLTTLRKSYPRVLFKTNYLAYDQTPLFDALLERSSAGGIYEICAELQHRYPQLTGLNCEAIPTNANDAIDSLILRCKEANALSLLVQVIESGFPYVLWTAEEQAEDDSIEAAAEALMDYGR